MYFIDDNTGISQFIHFMTHAQSMIHELNSKWWYSENGRPLERNKGELIALMHSELSECLEGVRKDAMDNHLPNRKMEEVELADTIIRILDYAEGFGLNVGAAMIEKLRYNRTRADHTDEARKLAGGKQF
jgi:hypothetical protein